MGIVDDAIKDRVGERRITNNVVPFFQRQLTGNHDGSILVSIFDDFHQFSPVIRRQTLRTPVIKN